MKYFATAPHRIGMHLIRIVFLYLLDRIVKVKNLEISRQNDTIELLSSLNLNGAMTNDSLPKIKPKDALMDVFGILNFHRSKMNEFLCHRFLSLRETTNNGIGASDMTSNRTHHPFTDQLMYDDTSSDHKTWLERTRESSTKKRVDLPNYVSKRPAMKIASAKPPYKEYDKVGETAKHTIGRLKPYPPVLYENNKKYNNVAIDLNDRKGIIIRKTRPLNVRKKPSPSLMDDAFMKNPYFRNPFKSEVTETSTMPQTEKPMTGDQRNMEGGLTHGDYTVNQPNVDNGSPIYMPNNVVTNTETNNLQWPISTQPVTVTRYDDRNLNNMVYNYGNMESTTALPPPNYAWNAPPSSFAPYGTENEMSDAPNYQETYFYGPDERPAAYGEYGNNCDCESKISETQESDLGETSEGDVNVIGILNSDMYEIILTTIALMAFGTYFVNMIMKITENQAGSTLMVVANNRANANGRKLYQANDDVYLDYLMKQIMLFIEEFRELVPEVADVNSTNARHNLNVCRDR